MKIVCVLNVPMSLYLYRSYAYPYLVQSTFQRFFDLLFWMNSTLLIRYHGKDFDIGNSDSRVSEKIVSRSLVEKTTGKQIGAKGCHLEFQQVWWIELNYGLVRMALEPTANHSKYWLNKKLNKLILIECYIGNFSRLSTECITSFALSLIFHGNVPFLSLALD